ncbi:MAG: hypothetical protein FJX20_00750 [Alphaproteobacteria bacterium]|nr:hypothetical protein [Alphaproteobacteria bacterium]
MACRRFSSRPSKSRWVACRRFSSRPSRSRWVACRRSSSRPSRLRWAACRRCSSDASGSVTARRFASARKGWQVAGSVAPPNVRVRASAA